MGDDGERSLSPDDGYDEIDVLEPYTAGEFASRLDSPKRRIRTREAPVHECPDCGNTYEVEFLHSVLSAVQFCPRCGTQL